MELTCIAAVKDIWQLQPYWLHPCKICDQGRSVGKIKFTRTRKIVLTYKGPVMSTVSRTAAICFIERWTLERVVCSETSYKTKEDNLSKIERNPMEVIAQLGKWKRPVFWI